MTGDTTWDAAVEAQKTQEIRLRTDAYIAAIARMNEVLIDPDKRAMDWSDAKAEVEHTFALLERAHGR